MAHTLRLLPFLALLAGCTTAAPGYRYGPGSTVAPPYGQPVAPFPYGGGSALGQPAAPPAMITTSPLPPPGTFLPDRQPGVALPPVMDDGIEQPPVRDAPPAQAQAAPSADPVADILLAPPPSAGPRTPAPASLPEAAASDPAAGAVSKRPTDSNPMMGFRPMRGQTAPSF